MHTSDLHLGDEHLPCNHRERFDLCICPLLLVKAAMADWRPDVLVIAGDFFDNPRVSDELLARVWNVLDELPAPVVVVPGNHDALLSGNVYERVGGSGRRVHIVLAPEGEIVSLLDGALTVWGKPTIEHAPWHRPLQGAPPRPHRGRYVAVGHGEFIADRRPASAIQHGSPITIEDVNATNADYVALGHHDHARCVSDHPVPAWYSGAPLLAGGVLGVTVAAGVTVERVTAEVVHECRPGTDS
jgi:DNA repair exonuclease SbcCD nuclease subunit